MTEFRAAFPESKSVDSTVSFLDLIDVADQVAGLNEEERLVQRQLVFDGCFAKGVTAAQFLKNFETATRTERREMVDQARVNAGLRTIEREKQFQSWRAANEAIRVRQIQVCAAQECETVPTDHLGQIRAVQDRKWFCEKHRDLAGPEDHLPPEGRGIDWRTMGEIATDAEKAQIRAESSRRERRWRERVEEARRRDEEQARIDEARLAEIHSHIPEGFPKP